MGVGQKLPMDLAVPVYLRYIPACAGETYWFSVSWGFYSGYIPACAGETANPLSTSSTSPRVRGKRTVTPPAGYIPACAGETLGSSDESTPRVCGGNSFLRYIPACAGETCGPHPYRYIPACAGETRRGAGGFSTGTSPRVRGKRMTSRSLPRERYIPACAGETPWVHPRVCGGRLTCSMSRSGARVHPRVCGGNAPSWVSTVLHHGTSPRVRGKRAALS